MSDNLENEFNSFFGGDDSLFKKLGEEKARRVLTMLKQMLGYDEDNNKVFKPFPFKRASETFNAGDGMGEPDEVIETFLDGITTIKKIWRDNSGKIIKTTVESNYEENGETPRIDFDLPANIGLPMIIGLNPLDMGSGFLDFLRNPNNMPAKPKKKRTLDELLKRAVEVENYDLAADVKKLIEQTPMFLETFKKDMNDATQKEDVEAIKKLTEVFDAHKKSIQKLLDMNEHLFED